MMRTVVTRWPVLVLTGLLCIAAEHPAVADEDDHDRARRALEAGEVLPLRAILDAVERNFVGEVIEVELEREHGAWIYEIKMLAPGGSFLELELDARTARILKAEGRDVDGARRDRHGRRD